MADLEKLVEELSKLSVLEAAELVKALEEKWGVSAAAPVAMAAGPAAAAAVEEVEEKTEFTVVLKATGPKKIDVLENVSKDVANDAKAKLVEAGAEVVLE
jgi:large subunit ribosomal protein L7/L12